MRAPPPLALRSHPRREMLNQREFPFIESSTALGHAAHWARKRNGGEKETDNVQYTARTKKYLNLSN